MALAATARQSRIQKFFQSWAILATEKYLPRKTPCLSLATKKNLHCTSAMSSATGDVPPAVPVTKPPAAPGSESAVRRGPAIEPPADQAKDDDQHTRKGRVETLFSTLFLSSSITFFFPTAI